MIKRQNSEKIFLQPIDQHYNDENSKHELKFSDDFDKMIDCLNMSTDSETLSRKDSTDDDSSYKIENALKGHWRHNVESLKVNQKQFFKNAFFQKIAMFRNTLENRFKSRTYSCPNKNVKLDVNYINPFVRRSSHVFVNECYETNFEILEDGGLK